MSTPTTTSAPAAALGRLWKTGLIGAAVAIVVSLVGFAIANVADASFSVSTTAGSDPSDVTPVHVIVSTLVGFLAGLLVASAITKWTGRDLRLAQIIGAVIAIISVVRPLTLQMVGRGSDTLRS